MSTTQDTDLIDAAKKAGAKVVVYGPLGSETGVSVVKIFTQKTGVIVENWLAASKILEPVLAQRCTRSPIAVDKDFDEWAGPR